MIDAMETVVLSLYLLVVGAALWLKRMNLRHLRKKGEEVPPGFEGAIDGDILQRSLAYTLETSRLEVVGSLLDCALVIVFLFGGGLAVYDRWIASLTGRVELGAVLFFLGLLWAETIVGIPFSLYRNFGIEARYGFNQTTGRIWVADLVKSTVVSSLLTAILVGVAIFLMGRSSDHWWLWVWGFFVLFSLFVLYVSPYVIEPLFFTFKPVEVEGFEGEIRLLMEKAGLRVDRVFQVDASRRSRHANAYFSGIGRVKRIVLFDTLLEQMNREEILAVLAHEAGHWKRRHLAKMIIATQAGAIVILYLAFKVLPWAGLPGLAGLPQASLPVRLIIVGFLGALLAFPLTPLASFISRRHEWEADRFAVLLTGRPLDLASALVKLARENLANLHPHPLYAAFYYSHPPIVERVRRLRDAALAFTLSG
jgi:STE24 endopeptidase